MSISSILSILPSLHGLITGTIISFTIAGLKIIKTMRIIFYKCGKRRIIKLSPCIVHISDGKISINDSARFRHVVKKPDKSSDGLIYRFYNISEVTLVFCFICTSIENSFHRLLRKEVSIGDQEIDRIDTCVKIFPNLVVISLVRVSNLGRNGSFGYLVDI